jgi:hypothetical protein
MYRMWADRHRVELAAEEARAARRAVREVEQASWHEAWRTYKADQGWMPALRPHWWNILGWVRWLAQLFPPGRPN